MRTKRISHYELFGDWFTMGRQLGSFVAADICGFNQRYFSDPVTLMRLGSTGRLEEYLRRLDGVIREYSPSAHQFLSGLGKGADLPADAILRQAILAELTHVTADRDWPGACLGCTAVCVASTHSATRGALIGQCWDFNFPLPPWFTARLTPHLDTPELLIFGMGSFFCCGGINALGLGVTFTSSGHLPNVPLTVGVPLVVLLLEALCEATYDEARDTIAAPVKCGSANVLLTDGYANQALIELAGHRVELIEDEPILVCGNHFQHPGIVRATNQDLTPADRPSREFADGSVARTERLRTLLAQAPEGTLSPDFLKRCLTDHENHPFSICAHEEGTILRRRTWGATLLEPAMRTVHLCPGQPCRETYETVTW